MKICFSFWATLLPSERPGLCLLLGKNSTKCNEKKYIGFLFVYQLI